MVTTYKYEPVNFFLITFFISWIPWFFAIYASWHPSLHYLLLPLVLGGLSGPMLGALIMLAKHNNKNLWNDFFQRLNPYRIKKRFVPIVLLLFPALIFFATTISLFFGQPVNQFTFITESSDLLLQGKNFLITLLVIFLIGPFEEIGWRGYGIDSLRAKFNLMKTSLIFGALWGLWHIPLFFIKDGGLQTEIWDVGLFHTFIYFTSLFLITIITNWLYMKNNRSILVAILFHSIYDLCLNIFHMTPVTWFIGWLMLLVVSFVIIQKNKDLFFKK